MFASGHVLSLSFSDDGWALQFPSQKFEKSILAVLYGRSFAAV